MILCVHKQSSNVNSATSESGSEPLPPRSGALRRCMYPLRSAKSRFPGARPSFRLSSRGLLCGCLVTVAVLLPLALLLSFGGDDDPARSATPQELAVGRALAGGTGGKLRGFVQEGMRATAPAEPEQGLGAAVEEPRLPDSVVQDTVVPSAPPADVVPSAPPPFVLEGAPRQPVRLHPFAACQISAFCGAFVALCAAGGGAP